MDDSKLKVPAYLPFAKGMPVSITDNAHQGLKIVNGAQYTAEGFIPDPESSVFHASPDVVIVTRPRGPLRLFFLPPSQPKTSASLGGQCALRLFRQRDQRYLSRLRDPGLDRVALSGGRTIVFVPSKDNYDAIGRQFNIPTYHRGMDPGQLCKSMGIWQKDGGAICSTSLLSFGCNFANVQLVIVAGLLPQARMIETCQQFGRAAREGTLATVMLN